MKNVSYIKGKVITRGTTHKPLFTHLRVEHSTSPLINPEILLDQTLIFQASIGSKQSVGKVYQAVWRMAKSSQWGTLVTAMGAELASHPSCDRPIPRQLGPTCPVLSWFVICSVVRFRCDGPVLPRYQARGLLHATRDCIES